MKSGGMWLLRFLLTPFMLFANHRGQDGFLVVGTSLLGELRGWEVDESAVAVEDTTLNDAWTTKVAGNKSWRGSATAWWDENDTNGQQVLTVGSTATLKFYIEGTGTGATYKTGSAVITGVRGAGSINGITERNFTFEGNGALTETTV